MGLLGHYLEHSLGCFLEQLPHDFRDVGSLSDSALVRYTHNIGHWPMNGLAHSLHILGVLVEIGLEGCSVGSSGYLSWELRVLFSADSYLGSIPSQEVQLLAKHHVELRDAWLQVSNSTGY